MSFLKYLRQLYSLDTLDTRFTTPSTVPVKDAAELRASASTSSSGGNRSDDGLKAQIKARAQPSKWGTVEFYVYYLVFITAIPQMFKAVYDVSKPSFPNYAKIEPLLSDGWIPGRKVDNSDAQYASFRDNVPYMLIVVILHPLLRRAYDYFSMSHMYTRVQPSGQGRSQLTQGLPTNAAADARLEQRISFDAAFAAIFVLVLHGFSSLKVLLILYLNFKIAKSLPRQYVPAATWIFNISVLFANELGRGYPYRGIWAFLFSKSIAGSQETNWGVWLDSYGGLIPRWEVLFNITVLRLISFNMDYYWSTGSRSSSPIEKKQLDLSNLSERDRVTTPARADDYSFRNFFAYALYSPLYLTGPIITFNDYISQQRYKAPSITRTRTTMYAIRFVIVLLTMEVMIHFLYMVAIFKSNPDWEAYSPLQLSMLGFFNLNHIWLKLLIPWRFFRLWALMDGIDPPENMVRCMSDNYSALAFWRGWHRSYNRWIVRYIYIPLGGSRVSGVIGKIRAMINYLAVFTFVALWHDIQLRLLMWGWLISLFVLPEVLGNLAFPAKRWRDRPTAYRVLRGIGATGNILMMMAANLVGFAIGVDGLIDLAKGIVGSYSGLGFLLAACGALFVGAQVMFEVREQEHREGIRLSC